MKLLNIRRKAEFTFGAKEDSSVPRPMPRHTQTGETISRERVGSIKTPSIPQQTGQIKDPIRDASRKALLPGKRRSKTGKIYFETRRNRSDSLGSKL